MSLQKKKKRNVTLYGATVFFSARGHVAFLNSAGNLYWVSDNDSALSSLPFREGDLVWIYVVDEISKIISVTPSSGEKELELPVIDPVEI